MTTAVLQQQLQHQITSLYDLEDDTALKRAISSIKRIVTSALSKKEPRLDAKTLADIEQAHKEHDAGLGTVVHNREELHAFLRQIEMEANV